jgi:hypothetical protein
VILMQAHPDPGLWVGVVLGFLDDFVEIVICFCFYALSQPHCSKGQLQGWPPSNAFIM